MCVPCKFSVSTLCASRSEQHKGQRYQDFPAKFVSLDIYLTVKKQSIVLELSLLIRIQAVLNSITIQDTASPETEFEVMWKWRS
jgi:hypothetical protein